MKEYIDRNWPFLTKNKRLLGQSITIILINIYAKSNSHRLLRSSKKTNVKNLHKKLVRKIKNSGLRGNELERVQMFNST